MSSLSLLVGTTVDLVQPFNCFKNYVLIDCNDPETNNNNNRWKCLLLSMEKSRKVKVKGLLHDMGD